MKYIFTIVAASCLFMATAQNKTFEHQGHFIGASLSGQEQISRCMMSDFIKIGSTYYLYFTVEDPNDPGYILYATSTDLNTWVIGDTAVFGVDNVTDRQYVLGGPRVVKLPNGQYRMFYRTAPQYTAPNEPMYHIRSSVSSDGMNFTPEGIRIEINSFNSASPFSHVGHSEFYYDDNGDMRALLTAKEVGAGNGPDKIYTAISTNDGQSWTGFQVLYSDSHDPVVALDSNGVYHTYFTYLNTYFKTASSSDGITWPSVPDTLWLLGSSGDTLTEGSSPVKLADLSALVKDNGDIIIASNYASAPGPWTEIAWFGEIPLSVSENADSPLWIYPNPAQNEVRISGCENNLSIQLFDISGRLISDGVLLNQMFSVSNLNSGIYFYRLTQQDGKIRYEGKIIKE